MKIRKVAAVIAVNSTGKILITKRALSRINGGYWDVPAGGIEDGETPEDAAIRETKEEAGIKIQNLKKGMTVSVQTGDLVQEITFFMSKVENPDVVLSDEHTEFKWVEPSEIFDYQFGLATDAVKKILKDFGLI